MTNVKSIKPISANKCSFLEREFFDGFSAKVVTISPQDAEEILENNPDNRNVSTSKVTQYASDLERGKWAMNGESIIIAADGTLTDGQHRLWAIIEANTPMRSVVVFGVERETRTTVDQGKTRGAGDYLAMRGHAYSTNMAAVAKMAICYEATSGRSIQDTSHITNADAVDYAEANLALMAEAAQRGALAPKSTRNLASPSLLALWVYILHNKGPVAEEYIEQVLSGENIAQRDVAYKVRERLASIPKGNRQPRTEAFLRGWVAYRNGKQLTTGVRILGELPKI